MVGGISTSFVLELVVDAAIHEIWKWHFELNRCRAMPGARALAALLPPEDEPRLRVRHPKAARVDAHSACSRSHNHGSAATQSLASLFPCQIGVTWTPPPLAAGFLHDTANGLPVAQRP